MTENLVRLKMVHGVGNATIWRLLRHFGDSDRVLGASAAAVAAVKGMSPEKAALVLSAADIDPRHEMDKAAREGVDIIPYDDPDYPKPLLHSYDPPVVLYVRGRLTEADQVAVGIVGTRRASPYGRDQARHIAGALSRGGYSIVSGLARGIDTFAHLGAIDAGGRTVGVLGCGFDHMYPEENRDLALLMSRNGAVVSEFTMATPPSRDTFPTRNRIIAGMSLGLLVIEAPLRSGSLITARLANEIGRTVFAVPGRVGDACSEGCNKLIRDGCVMVTGVDDIFGELNPSLPPPVPPKKSGKAAGVADAAPRQGVLRVVSEKVPEPEPPAPEPPPAPRPRLNEDQKRLLECLDGEWRSIDDIIEASGMPAGKVTAMLAGLRLARLAEAAPGNLYRLLKR